MNRPKLTESAWIISAALLTLGLLGFLSLDYTRPLSLSGDHTFLLVQARAMKEGAGFFSTPFLGFPFVQNTAYFPLFEPGLKLIVWLLAFLPIGPFLIVKLWYIIGISLVVTSCYWALRQFETPPHIAAVLAIVFVVCPYFERRAFGHDYLAVFLTVPFGCAIALMFTEAQNTAAVRDILRKPFTIVGIVVIGTCGIYYAFFSLMFISLAAALSSFRARSPAPLLIAGAIGGIVVALLVVGAFGPNLPGFLAGQFAGPKRPADHQLFHGLSLGDAVFTLRGFSGFADTISQHIIARAQFMRGEGRNEWPGILLSGIIILSPFFLLAAADCRKTTASRIAFASATFIAIGCLFAMRGGAGYLFNMFVMSEFRAQARIMPLLTFFAVMILAMISTQCLSSSRRRINLLGVSIPLIALVAAFPSFNAVRRGQLLKLESRQAQAAEYSIEKMLAEKNKFNLQTILQIPVSPWPETPRLRKHDFYMDQLPFVYDKVKPLAKWSYGSAEKEPGADLFRSQFAEGAITPPIETARKYGFDAILLSKDAYTIDQLAKWKSSILKPDTCRIYEDEFRELIMLRPCGS